jgi:hypothetical protein
MFELAIAIPSLALVVAGWDTMRRHYNVRRTEVDGQRGLTAEYTAKLEQRVAGLEKGQREIAMRLDAPSKLSRFQRG